MSKKLINSILVLALLLISIFFIINNKETNNKDSKNNNENTIEISNKEEILNFIESLDGLELNEVSIQKEPIGFKVNAFAPDKTIVNGINYFLKSNKNNKIEDINVKSKNDRIAVNVYYKVTEKIKTPIEFNVKISLDENNNLILDIEDLKFLELKISNWIVDIVLENFAEDWFSGIKDFKADFNKSTVVIYKENFKGTEIKNINLDNGLNIEILIDLDKVL